MSLDYDTYFEYHDQSYMIIVKVADYYGIELQDLRWQHFKDYAIDVEMIEVIPYNFGEVSSKYLSGNIMQYYGNYGISFNPRMVKGRQIFSILHELGHYFFDMDKTKNTQVFSDLLDGKGYSSEDEPKENRANVFASLTLANNEALRKCLKNGMGFSELCTEFQMSNAALYVRLYDLLTKLFMLNHNIAIQVINNFRYAGNNSKLVGIICVGLTEQEEF